MRKQLWVLTGAGAVVLLCVYLASWSIALQAPMALEYEGPCLWAAHQLSLGHNIYDGERLTSAPWHVMIYTPLYFVLGAAIERMTGEAGYVGMRAVSMFSFLLSLIYLWRLLCRLNKDRLIVALSVLTFASFIPIWSWSWKARVDMLSVALSIMAVYYFTTAAAKLDAAGSSKLKSKIIAYLPSVLLSVAAVYTKQPSIVIPAVVCVFLFVKKRTMDALVYGALCLVFAVPIMLVLQSLTNGGFWAHMTFASKMPFSVFDLEKHLSWIGPDWPKLWMTGLLAVAWLLSARRGKLKPGDEAVLPLVLTVISGALTVYTLGTTYANLNHGFIFLVGCAWLVSVFLPTLPRLGSVLLIATIMLSTSVIATRLPIMQDIKEAMAKTPPVLYGPHFRDSASGVLNPTLFVEDPQLAILTGTVPLFVDPATFLQVWDRNGRSLDDIIAAIDRKKYPVAIVNKQDSDGRYPIYFWNEAIMQAIRNNYKKVGEVSANGEVQDVYVAK